MKYFIQGVITMLLYLLPLPEIAWQGYLAWCIYGILLLFTIGFPVSAVEYGSVTIDEVRSIYDADTFRVTINGWPDIIGKGMSIRVLGVDAPEMRGKCQSEKLAARRAKQHTVELLRSAKVIELTNMKRGKYFRILANVMIDGKSLANSLIRNGLARPYDGGKRVGWCD